MVIMVSFGGGVNSAALLVGMHERDERPDAILFADTGARHRQGTRTTLQLGSLPQGRRRTG